MPNLRDIAEPIDPNDRNRWVRGEPATRGDEFSRQEAIRRGPGGIFSSIPTQAPRPSRPAMPPPSPVERRLGIDLEAIGREVEGRKSQYDALHSFMTSSRPPSQAPPAPRPPKTYMYETPAGPSQAPNPNYGPSGHGQWGPPNQASASARPGVDPSTGEYTRPNYSGQSSQFRGGGMPSRGGGSGSSGGWGGSGPMPPPETMPPRGGQWSVWQSNATNIMNTYQQRPFNQDDLQKARDALGFLQKMGPVMEKLASSSGKLTEKQEKQIRVFEKAYDAIDRAERQYQRVRQDEGPLSASMAGYAEMRAGATGALRRFHPAYRAAGQYVGAGGQFMEQMSAINAQEPATVMELLMQGGRTGRRARSLAWQQGGTLQQSGIANLLGEGGVEALSSGMRSISRGLGRMWMGSTARGIFSNPVFSSMEQYMGTQASRDMALMQSGIAGGIAGGMLTNLTNRYASRDLSQYYMGQQAYAAWGNIDPRLNPSLARGAPGFAQSVLGPSLATGVQLGIFSAPLGIAAAAGQAALGTVSYSASSASNLLETGRARIAGQQRGFLGGIEQMLGNTQGFLGTVAQGAGGALGILNPEQQRAAAFSAPLVRSMQLSQQGALGLQDIQRMYRGVLPEQDVASVYQSMMLEGITGYGGSEGERLQSQLRQFSTVMRLNPNASLASPFIGQVNRLEQLGISNINQLVGMGTASQGTSAYSQEGFAGGFQDLNSFINQAVAQGTPIEVALQQYQEATSRAGNINVAARIAGERGVNWRNLVNEFGGDFASQGIANNFRMNFLSSRQGLRDSGIGAAVGQSFGSFLRGGDLYNANRINEQFGAALQFDQRMQMYGVNDRDAANRIATMSTAGGQDFAAMMGLANADPRVASMHWQRMGNIRFQTMDVASGMNAFYGGVSGQEYNWLRQDSNIGGFQQFRLSRSQAAGGQRAWEAQITMQQRDLEAYQYQQQRDSRNVDYVMTTGGQGLSNQSASILGRGLESLAEVFQKYGVPFSAGNGMSGWQVQDRQTEINRQQQMFQMQQSGAYLGINQAQFEMTGRHFYERFNLNQQQFQWRTGFQRNEMMINRQQQVAQQQWQAEDMAFSRDQSELGFAWSMQDYDRDIRYARGRQKRDLMRNKSRDVIRFSMQMGQMDRQEERFGTQVGWSEEAFERQRQYFEQNVKFQEQEMEMQRRHFEENRSLERQRLDLQRQSHDQQIAWIREEWALQDQSRLLERQSYQLQYQMQSQMDEKVRSTQLTVQMYSDALQASNARLQEANASLAAFASNLSLIELYANYNSGTQTGGGGGGGWQSPAAGSGNNYYGGYVPGQGTWTSQPGAVIPLPPPMDSWQAPGSGSQITQFASGGFTGNGPMYEPAGIVHKGEYVVPSGGGLMIRGDNPRSVLLMERMVELLEIISENPTSFQAILQNPLNIRPTTLIDNSRAVPARY